MLCCISRKAVGAPKLGQSSLIPLTNYSENPSSHPLPTLSNFKCDVNSSNFTNDKLKEELGDEPPMLLPCAICARTFKPQSLEKHIKICEQAALKKRKPFDSSKQRIQGTELEEFLPRQMKKLNYHEEKINPKTSWKQTHDEFLRTIRAAREDSMDVIPNRSTSISNVNSGAPTRANEKGQCPTCLRQFGIKAYDRHVAWCKERITRAPSSPATNVAKERLDARINYRAPNLKNRRMTNREKYAPGNFALTNVINKNTSLSSIGTKGIKDTNSLLINKKHVDNAIVKLPGVSEKQSGQGKNDGTIAPGSLKSRLFNKPTNCIGNPDSILPPLLSCSPQTKNNQYYLCEELSDIQNLENNSTLTAISLQNRSSTRKLKVRTKKLRKQKNIVITQSRGKPKINDITVNDDSMGMMILPCFNYKQEEMITWKQINDDKFNIQCTERSNANNEFFNLNHVKWIFDNPELDRTYLINDFIDIEFNNNTKVVNNTLCDPTPKLIVEDSKKDLYELPPINPMEFKINITSTSTPLSYGMNDSHRNDKISINNANNLDDVVVTTMTNGNSNEQGDTYVINSTLMSSNFDNTLGIAMNTDKVNKNSSDTSMDSYCGNETKINSTFPSDESNELVFQIPQLNEEINDGKTIISIDKLFFNEDVESSDPLSHDFTSDSLDSVRSNEILMKKGLRKKMNILRDSTDYLISSIETNNEQKNQSLTSNIHLKINKNNNRQVENQGILPDQEMPYWKRMMKTSRKRFINNFNLMRNPKIISLPPLITVDRRIDVKKTRPPWINYVRRHPDFNLVLTGRIGMCQDDDPFLIVERQLNELLSDTCSDQSFPDSPSNHNINSKSSKSHYPLSQSTAFVEYSNSISLDIPSEKRESLIAPPTAFDDLSTGFSSDSTETNSITRELFTNLESSNCRRENIANKNKGNQSVLGRRVIIDKSKALGCTNDSFNVDNNKSKNSLKCKNHKLIGKTILNKVVRPQVIRSNSVRAMSAPKNEERNDLNFSHNINSRSSSGSRFYKRHNNRQNSGSNLSLSSISSENETKQSNFGLDDLMNSFDDDSISYPSLKSFLKNDSLSTSSPIQVNRDDNGQMNDGDLSLSDSYKQKEHSKISVDSAYSSLNRKYSNHGLNNNDLSNRRNEVAPSSRINADNEITSKNKSKMSKFCYECGTRFPDTAKFCCECGVQRLAL